MYAWGRFEHGELGLGLGNRASSSGSARGSHVPDSGVGAAEENFWGPVLVEQSGNTPDSHGPLDEAKAHSRDTKGGAVAPGAFLTSSLGRAISTPTLVPLPALVDGCAVAGPKADGSSVLARPTASVDGVDSNQNRFVSADGGDEDNLEIGSDDGKTEDNGASGATLDHVECGCFHSAVVLSNGALLTFGGDGSGQCGHGDVRDQWLPRRVENLKDHPVVQMSGSRSHSMVVSEGRVLAWGKAKYGQLGFGGKNWDQMNPREVPGLDEVHITHTAAGETHSLALSKSGQVFSWGRGKYGRLGLNSEQAQMYPKLITTISHVRITRIVCGHHHSMASSATGQLFVWGCNNYGQLGTRSQHSLLRPEQLRVPGDLPIVDIAAGCFHSLALSKEGVVYSWGLNAFGQLGTGDTDHRLTPTAVETFAMLSESPSRASAVRAGQFHSAVLTANGKLYMFGDNRYGQLGLGDFENRELPSRVDLPSGNGVRDVALGNWHTIALEGDEVFLRQSQLSNNARVELGVKGYIDAQGADAASPSTSKKPEPVVSVGGFFGLFALCTGARGPKNPPPVLPEEDDQLDDQDVLL